MLSPNDIEAIAELLATKVLSRLAEQAEIASPTELVSRAKMARMISVSLPTLDRMVAKGNVPSELIGTRRLFNPRDVIAAVHRSHSISSKNP